MTAPSWDSFWDGCEAAEQDIKLKTTTKCPSYLEEKDIKNWHEGYQFIIDDEYKEKNEKRQTGA